MTQDWLNDDIIEQFTLLSPEIKFLGINDPPNHLGKAILLKFFQQNYWFPESLSEISEQAIEYVAQQLDLPPHVINQYDWGGTRMREHRTDIRDLKWIHQGYVCGSYSSPILTFRTYFCGFR